MDNSLAPLNSLKFKKSFRSDAGRWYKAVQELGRGGNAVTFLVMQTDGPTPGMLYAMKIFYKITEQRRTDQFIAEVEFLTTCNHPCVMQVVDTGTYRARISDTEYLYYPYVVAEYLPRTLNDAARENNLSFVEKTSYIIQLLAALDYIGNLPTPVIHRDIKPQNIFIKGQTCVLGDFGLMKKQDNDADGDDALFQASTKPGMPFFYRTPDLIAYAKGGYRLTTASDMFQLGLVAAFLFTGRNPCNKPKFILENITLEPVATVPGRQGGGVAKLIERMLTLDPRQRPTPKEMTDPWQNVFWEASQKAIDLEGRAL